MTTEQQPGDDSLAGVEGGTSSADAAAEQGVGYSALIGGSYYGAGGAWAAHARHQRRRMVDQMPTKDGGIAHLNEAGDIDSRSYLKPDTPKSVQWVDKYVRGGVAISHDRRADWGLENGTRVEYVDHYRFADGGLLSIKHANSGDVTWAELKSPDGQRFGFRPGSQTQVFKDKTGTEKVVRFGDKDWYGPTDGSQPFANLVKNVPLASDISTSQSIAGARSTGNAGDPEGKIGDDAGPLNDGG